SLSPSHIHSDKFPLTVITWRRVKEFPAGNGDVTRNLTRSSTNIRVRHVKRERAPPHVVKNQRKLQKARGGQQQRLLAPRSSGAFCPLTNRFPTSNTVPPELFISVKFLPLPFHIPASRKQKASSKKDCFTPSNKPPTGTPAEKKNITRLSLREL
ncbi:hypothetical protein SK128_028149, partial [Halocaridina rubra]